MVESVNLAQKNMSFLAKKPDKKKANEETRILPNTFSTKVNQGFQKTTSAFIDYPAKGLKGDINTNFYEFLTMGIVPYLVGSATFMVVFNCLAKYLDAKSVKAYSKLGNKMALGVVLYGLFKTLSKNLVTKPVKWATGVDTEMPYQNKVYNLPKSAGDSANIEVQYQQRTVFDSNEFFRKDLLKREYFDKIAKKNGCGDNLNDSVTEATPIIQSVVSTSNLAKSLSSYGWAAVGVGLASQDGWYNFFDAIKGWKPKNFVGNMKDITKAFGKSFIDSCKSLWKGNPNAKTPYMKHAGKGLIGLASAMTVFLTANTIIRAKNLAKNRNTNTIDKTKESTVI